MATRISLPSLNLKTLIPFSPISNPKSPFCPLALCLKTLISPSLSFKNHPPMEFPNRSIVRAMAVNIHSNNEPKETILLPGCDSLADYYGVFEGPNIDQGADDRDLHQHPRHYSWEPLTELPDKKCKRCGLYEIDKVKTDDIYNEWELYRDDFVDGNYVHYKEKEFNATFACPECITPVITISDYKYHS